LPLAISSAVWSSLNGIRWALFSIQSNPLFGFRLPLESFPTEPSPPAAAGRLLSWASGPFSTSRIEGPLAAGFAYPLRSAFRVWLPSWRLTPFGPVPVLFRTGSAPGIHPSEVSPLGKRPGCYHSEGPTYRCTWQCSRRRSAGPARQASVSGPRSSRESLAIVQVFSLPTAGSSLGFRPSRVLQQRPRPEFRPVSSHALCESDSRLPEPPAHQSIDRPPLGPIRAPHRSAAPDEATLIGFLHRLSILTIRA